MRFLGLLTVVRLVFPSDWGIILTQNDIINYYLRGKSQFKYSAILDNLIWRES